MKLNLSVVLIAHNEEENIGGMIRGLLGLYDDEILEIVVIDDNSNDKTAFIVEELQKEYKKIRLIRRAPPCGVGRALRAGFESVDTKADYILSMDSDFIENIAEVALVINEAKSSGYDGVIGSRFIKGSNLIYYPLLKKMFNRIFHLVVRVLLNIKHRDLSNNFKLYKKKIFQELPYRSNDFAMNAETGILPLIYGYRLKEVPISWIGRRGDMGKSKFSILKYGPAYITVIFDSLGRKIRKQACLTPQ